MTCTSFRVGIIQCGTKPFSPLKHICAKSIRYTPLLLLYVSQEYIVNADTALSTVAADIFAVLSQFDIILHNSVTIM